MEPRRHLREYRVLLSWPWLDAVSRSAWLGEDACPAWVTFPHVSGEFDGAQELLSPTTTVTDSIRRCRTSRSRCDFLPLAIELGQGGAIVFEASFQVLLHLFHRCQFVTDDVVLALGHFDALLNATDALGDGKI